jgi:hypothetical protein
MQKIPLNLARPGMKLGKPVLRDNGLVLVAENTELTESLLQRLNRMDISTLTVQGNPVDMGDGSGGTNPYTARAKRLDHLFRAHEGDAWMQQLRDHLRSYFQFKAASAAAMDAGGENTPGGQS